MPLSRDMAQPIAVWLAACAVVVTIGPAHADLIGSPALPPTLSATELATVAANPALAALAESDPWVVRTALDDLAAAEHAGDSSARGNPSMLDPADAALTNGNPAILEITRSSPEAAVDLLALIRAAAGKGNGPSSKAAD